MEINKRDSISHYILISEEQRTFPFPINLPSLSSLLSPRTLTFRIKLNFDSFISNLSSISFLYRPTRCSTCIFSVIGHCGEAQAFASNRVYFKFYPDIVTIVGKDGSNLTIGSYWGDAGDKDGSRLW